MTPPPGGPAPDVGTSGRHEARERAVALLYEAELKGLAVGDVLAALPVAPDRFAAELAIGVGDHQAELDDVIRAHAHNWSLERMPLLDRTILRLGVYELAHRPDVPVAVAIDEAVELAKAYGTDDSPRFVNGVLAAAAREIRPPSG